MQFVGGWVDYIGHLPLVKMLGIYPQYTPHPPGIYAVVWMYSAFILELKVFLVILIILYIMIIIAKLIGL